MTSNVDNRPGGGTGGMTPRSHYTAQTSYVCATFIAAAQTPYAPNTYLGFGGQQVAATQPTLNTVPNAAGTYNFNIGALPYGARVLRAYSVTALAWAGATNAVTVGNVSGGAQFVTGGVFGAAGTNTLGTLAATNAQYVETVDMTPVWVSVVISAGTLTSGQSDIIIEYVVTHGPQGQF